jgi:hypothetical protein
MQKEIRLGLLLFTLVFLLTGAVASLVWGTSPKFGMLFWAFTVLSGIVTWIGWRYFGERWLTLFRLMFIIPIAAVLVKILLFGVSERHRPTIDVDHANPLRAESE